MSRTIILYFHIFMPPDFKFWRFLVKFTVSFSISPYLLIFFHLDCFALLLFPPLVLFSWPASEPAIQPHLERKTFFNLTLKPQASSSPT